MWPWVSESSLATGRGGAEALGPRPSGRKTSDQPPSAIASDVDGGPTPPPPPPPTSLPIASDKLADASQRRFRPSRPTTPFFSFLPSLASMIRFVFRSAPFFCGRVLFYVPSFSIFNFFPIYLIFLQPLYSSVVLYKRWPLLNE